MGLNPGPLTARGTYPAPICCMLTNGHMPHCTNTVLDMDIPYIDHQDETRFITGIKDGVCTGYKYFAFDGSEKTVTVTARGDADGLMKVYTDLAKEPVAEIPVTSSETYREFSAELTTITDTQPLYFVYEGTGALDWLSFEIS